jgi:hypothetical protein
MLLNVESPGRVHPHNDLQLELTLTSPVYWYVTRYLYNGFNKAMLYNLISIYTTDYIRLAYPHLYSIDEQGYKYNILNPEPNHIRIGV